MLSVSNSQTPGTREIPTAHLITTEQAVPLRTLHLLSLLLPQPEEAGSVSPLSTVTAVKPGMVPFIWGGLLGWNPHACNHLPNC